MTKAALCVSGARNEHLQHLSGDLRAHDYRNVWEENSLRSPATGPEQPKNAEYATVSARLYSFSGWDSQAVDVHDLVNAGFYYTGIKDYVRCFFCGGGIKDWDAGDHPWMEHARWYPNCAYVKQTMGEDFVRLCQSSDVNDRERCQQLLAQARQQSVPQNQDQILEDLRSNASTVVLGMGYNQTRVIEAIRYARNKYGLGTLRAQQLMEYLLENGAPNSSGHAGEATPAATRPSSSLAQRKPTTPAEEAPCPSDPEGAKLFDENRQLKEQSLCKICLDQEACIVFIPCGHLAACAQCSTSLRNCAICRSLIQQKVRVYQS